MKRMVVAAVLLAFIVCPAFAFGADTVTLKAKMGDVTFNHKVHGEKTDCKTCHGAGTPGKLNLGGKEPAHKLCMDCHKEKKAGPTKCNECHKKK